MNDREKLPRLRASLTSHVGGAWLQALPISSVGLRGWTTTSSGGLWVCVSAPTCRFASHTRAHAVSLWMPVAERMGWPAREAQGGHPRHGLLNDARAAADALRAQVPSCKEPAGLSRSDGKRSTLTGPSLIPWSRGRCVTWDVTSPDTPRPIPSPVIGNTGRATKRLLEQKRLHDPEDTAPWQSLIGVWCHSAFETLGAWGVEAAVFVAELGRRMTAATGDPREDVAPPLQRLLGGNPVRGNAIACRGTMPGVVDQN